MHTENWKQIKELLQEVLSLAPEKREQFLTDSGASPEIRAEVESLLAFETESEDLMRLSAVEFSKDFFEPEDDAANHLIGQHFGAYKIVRELGQGGMGAVYLATRTDGKFKQQVALKLLKREMNTAALRRRFEQEREILASLEHPNIARLLDAGTTSDKIPFLAMEYVEGLPVDEFCRLNQSDLNQRLDLFRKVCSAVNFAHRNLIVHRDLKPSNIIVNREGLPKLLDFGISKILGAELEQVNASTVTKLGVMTPAYASPEQLQNKSVTTATDIYSLGVILYELLSGHRPFEAKENDIKEIYKAVLETEPPPPSALINMISKNVRKQTEAKTELLTPDNSEPATKINNFAGDTESNRNRQTLAPAVNLNAPSLRGDLDNIVLKALRKEPERRYSSAENFADDIHRHQRGLPVTARPNTFSYRAEKFIKRNRASVFAGILIILAVVAGIIATLWQTRVARAERAKAERRFNDVRKFANSNLFDVYPEVENLEGSIKAREKILTNALEYLDSLSQEAGGDLELESELATAYEKVGDVQGAQSNSSLGDVKAGLESYEKAGKLREAVYAANPANLAAKEKLANNYYTTARTLWNDSQTKEAEAKFEKGLKLRRELVAAQPDSVEAQNRLATLLIDYGAIPAFNQQSEKALALMNEAVEILGNLRRKDPDNPDLKKTQTRLWRTISKPKSSVGDYDGALDGLNQALVVSQELAAQFPDDFRVQRGVWLTDSRICELFIEKQDGLKAVEPCLRSLDFPQAALAKEPENGVVAYDLAISHFNAARAFRQTKNFSQTVEQSEKAIEVMSKMSQKSPKDLEYKRNLAIYKSEMARAEIELKQPDKAALHLQSAIETLLPIVEADKEATYQYDLAYAYRLFAQAVYQKGDKAKAAEFADKAIAIINQLKTENSLRESDKDLLTELENEKAEYRK